jgi:hypothetical protein
VTQVGGSVENICFYIVYTDLFSLRHHLQLVPRQENVDLHIHSPIHLHGIVLS